MRSDRRHISFVARGELPVIRFGRRTLVPNAALLELLGLAASGN
jgi:hypothetical protein